MKKNKKISAILLSSFIVGAVVNNTVSGALMIDSTQNQTVDCYIADDLGDKMLRERKEDTLEICFEILEIFFPVLFTIFSLVDMYLLCCILGVCNKETQDSSVEVVLESAVEKNSTVYVPDFSKKGIKEVYGVKNWKEENKKIVTNGKGWEECLKEAYKNDPDVMLAILANYIFSGATYGREDPNKLYICSKKFAIYFDGIAGVSESFVRYFANLVNRGEIVVDTSIEVESNYKDASKLGANFDLCQVCAVSKKAFYGLAKFCLDRSLIMPDSCFPICEDYYRRRSGVVPMVYDVNGEPKNKLERAEISEEKLAQYKEELMIEEKNKKIVRKFKDSMNDARERIELIKTYYLLMFNNNDIKEELFKILLKSIRFVKTMKLLSEYNFLTIKNPKVFKNEEENILESITYISEIGKWALASCAANEVIDNAFLVEIYNRHEKIDKGRSNTYVPQDLWDILKKDIENKEDSQHENKKTVLGIEDPKKFRASLCEYIFCALQPFYSVLKKV